MAHITRKTIQRVRHHQDERLLAADLNADMAYEAMLRRLHLRGLHDTWGVALGMRLAHDRDGKAVLVTPGLAYDCLGRELLLAVGTVLNAPTRPTGMQGQTLAYDLTVRYVEIELKSREQTGGQFCEQQPNLGLDFRWALAGTAGSPAAELLAEEIRLGEEVPLGRVLLDEKGVLSQPNYRYRRNAHPLLRPHLASNSIQPDWQEEVEKVDETSRIQGATFTAAINTAEGGFSQDTHYFVRLLPSPELETLLATGKLLGPLASINQPSYAGFSARVTFALVHENAAGGPKQMELLAAGMKTTRLFWLGAEPVTGCTPSFSQLYTVYGFPVMDISIQWSMALKLFSS